MSRGPERRDVGKVGQYEGLASKAARGEYELVEPLDYMILDLLQDEGSMFADLYPLGETVPALVKKLGGKLTNSQLTSRVRILHIQGLIVQKKSLTNKSGSTTVWQRSKVGASLLNKWKEAKKNGSSN
jgi:hypothetical protein